MKRTKKCPKCDGLRIGHLESQLDMDEQTYNGNIEGYRGGARQKPSARTVGYQQNQINTGWWEHGMVYPLVGTLEAYVCTECGYYETYVVEPRTIEWDKLVGFRWVNPDAPSIGPFR